MLLFKISFTNVSANQFNFSAETILPETQVDKEQSYFDIQVQPKEEQELVIKLHNDTDKDIKVKPEIASATTNVNGVVEYSPNDTKLDETLKYNLADLVKTEDEVVIPKQGSYDLKLKVTPPDETFQGLIAGGITLKEDTSDTEESDEKGLAIKNEYSYVIAILLRSDNTEISNPELNLKKVYPSQINARNVILSDFQNPQPQYLNRVTIISKIIKEGKKDPIIETEKSDIQIAPNTLFSYPVRQEGKKLEGGKYRADMTVYANQIKDGEHEYGKDKDGNPIRYQNKWDYSQEFTISNKTARELNKKDVTIKQDYTMWYIIGGLSIIIIGLLIWIFVTKRNKYEKK